MLPKDIVSEIAQMNRDEIKEAYDHLRQRIRVIESQATNKFRLNQAVQFVDRNFNIRVGNIKKINTKTIKVQVGPTTWSVSPSLLKPAEKPAQ